MNEGAGRTSAGRTSAIVPTLGQSPWLEESLAALRRSGGRELEIILVAQGEAGRTAAEGVAALCDQVVLRERPVGFAVANNLGLAVAPGADVAGDAVATVNDDVVVAADWLPKLRAALDADPALAAVQGVSLILDEAHPERARLADGCGLAWNRWLQAVQIGHGREAPPLEAPPRPIFGVSATAALYRRAALTAVADPRFGDSRSGNSGEGEPVFDAGLFAYYEDVDLACRLRSAGFGALLVPSARARHAGSTSGRRLALGGWPYIYANRHLVLARHLGRGYGRRLPRVLWRDALDLARAVGRLEPGRAAGIVAGWGRALRLLPRYLHGGAEEFDAEELSAEE